MSLHMSMHKKFFCALTVAGCCLSGVALAQVGVDSSTGANVGVGGVGGVGVGVGTSGSVHTPPPPDVNVQGRSSTGVRSGDAQTGARSSGEVNSNSTSPRDGRVSPQPLDHSRQPGQDKSP
jgi:hypothetical protein